MFRWLGRWFKNQAALDLRGLAICTVPCSGSNLLCHWLTSTGMLGRLLEYFNGPSRRALDEPTYPDDRHEQIEWILTEGSTPNGIYGVKLFAHHHAKVSPVIDWTQEMPNLVYGHLEQRDRLGQAISWRGGAQTRQYRSTQGVQGAINYDGTAIRERLDAINREYALWSEFFRQRRLQPVRVFYEHAVQNPQSTVDRFCTRIPGAVNGYPPERESSYSMIWSMLSNSYGNSTLTTSDTRVRHA